jgi:methionyl-tRNA synthetase
MCGTDEHGIKVQEAAIKAGYKSTQLFCDDISAKFKGEWDRFGIDYDGYFRTTDDMHKQCVIDMWSSLVQKNHIYLGSHEGWYSKADEAFVPESQVEEVNNIKVVAATGLPVEWVSETNYKFKLSAFQEPLMKWLVQNPDVIQPKQRYNEVLQFVTAGLEDISVSRLSSKVGWAITVPNDDKHCIYVWLDALCVYLTSAKKFGLKTHWPPAIQIVGKDIIKFHAIYQIAFLMAADLDLPKSIIAHAHWTVDGKKMSKSLGNVISPGYLVEEFGIEKARYFLLKAGSLLNDADFRAADVNAVFYADLADKLGNLFSRSASKSILSDGKCPCIDPQSQSYAFLDLAFISSLNQLSSLVDQEFSNLRFGSGIQCIINCIIRANQIFDLNAPWKLRKSSNPVHILQLNATIFMCLECLRICGILLQPVLPTSMATLLDRLGVSKQHRHMNDCVVGKHVFVQEIAQNAPVLFPKLQETKQKAEIKHKR